MVATLRFGVFFAIICMANNAIAAQKPWSIWLAEFRSEAIADGIEPTLFDEIFKTIRPHRRTLSLDNSQPEHRMTYRDYQKSRGDNYRIKLGVNYYKRYRSLLEEVGHAYGVNPCIITSIWGMETSYGRFMGSFLVIKSLATLAYDGRRTDFFRRELLLALHIVQQGHIDYRQYKGEWAGASGQPQFLPSSWFTYAVDYDGDGVKDIWKTKPDVFASIANYLAKKGWQPGEPWALEVHVPLKLDPALLGKHHEQPLAFWKQQGVRLTASKHWPDEALMAAIIKPDGGPYLMIFNNFRTLMKYNNSSFYAGTVGYMADKICRGAGSGH